MRRNLLRVLQKRAHSSRTALLKCMIDKLSEDHTQELQLASSAQHILQDEEFKKVDSNTINYDVALAKVKSDTEFDVTFVKSALTSVFFDAAFLELDGIVQHTMMTSASKIYRHLSSPNSPIISNSTVVNLINKYIELVPVHHASILTMLNVNKNMQDK